MDSVFKPWEALENIGDFLFIIYRIGSGMSPHNQVIFDRELAKQLTPFWYQCKSLMSNSIGWKLVNVLVM